MSAKREQHHVPGKAPLPKRPKLGSEHIKEADPTKFLGGDLWMQILSYVGPGHFAFVAGVNSQMKEWHKKCFSNIEEAPDVLHQVGFTAKRPATGSDTFYKAAFSSVPCAEYWNKITKEEECRLEDHGICATIAKHGNLEVLKWARQQNFGWYSSGMCTVAVKNGHLEILKYLHKNGCAWTKATWMWAAKYGHLECLKYAHDNGYPWGQETCERAAEGGHLECLQYAHDNGCPWNGWTCTHAAEHGQLECLQYAHENGCPWDENTCRGAAANGHLECLKYAHDNECPWDWRTYRWAIFNGHDDIAEWARNNGCPVDW